MILGYIVATSTMSITGRYVSMFFMASGFAGASTVLCGCHCISSSCVLYPGNALVLVWLANALPRPPAKRSAAIALVNAGGNIGTMLVAYTCEAELFH